MPAPQTALLLTLLALGLTAVALAAADPAAGGPMPPTAPVGEGGDAGAPPMGGGPGEQGLPPGPAPGPRLALPPGPGELRLTEVMPDPSCVPDAEGEWIELHNATDHPLDLSGVLVGGKRDRALPLSTGTLELAPGAYLLAGRSEVGGAAGAPVDVVVPRMVLGNRNGRIALWLRDVEIDALTYGEEAGLDVARGRALALDPAGHLDGGSVADGGWCPAPTRLRGPCGDHGSPGRASLPCPRRARTTRRR